MFANSVQSPVSRTREANRQPVNQDGRCVLYWMQRAQRGRDNAALNLAIDHANRLKVPVACIFALTDNYPDAQRRHYRFLVQGLVDAAEDLAQKGVPLIVRFGSPPEVVLNATRELKPAILIGDENPVRIGQLWRQKIATESPVRFEVVDADVVVPSAQFPKEEYAARTIRPKIAKVLDQFLERVPNPSANVAWPLGNVPIGEPVDEGHLMSLVRAAGGASELPDYRGGAKEAQRRLEKFIRQRLENYDELRNEPARYHTSELSAHLHFGHIDPIHVVLAVRASGGPAASIDAFVEEFVVRRELAVNFVARNSHYDTLEGCPDWARKTLARHADDPRAYLYDYDRLENADTHDPLWNAAQSEMVRTGRMHNYMRMYWAKKILEWTPNAETAFEIALKLNDKWEMDGRDPNGYTGVAWAIGGKHDRPWGERPIFGTVRFMSYESTRKKFDSRGYIERVGSLNP
ncbi:deoxyribodipyrimidine photolyase [bacterium]|nr:deoxyribodipyrimidine photolyase [bacterium]